MFGRNKVADVADRPEKLAEGKPWNIGANKWFIQWPGPLSKISRSKPAAASEETMISDAESYGREAGKAAGRGEHFAARIDVLPGREALSYAGDQRVARVKQNADAIRRDLDTQLSGLESQVSTAEQDEQWTQQAHERALAERAQYPQTAERNSLADTALYAVVLTVLACAEFPTIYSALQGSTLPPWAIILITGALSIIISLSAHIVGDYLWEYVATRDRAHGGELQLQEKTERILKLSIAAGIFVVMVVLMLKMYSIRTTLFVEAGNLTKAQNPNSESDGKAFSQLLLLLQLLFFIVALSMAFLRSRNAKERRANAVAHRRVRRLDADMEKSKHRLDADRQKKVALQAQIQTLTGLRESVGRAEELELGREAALLGEILKKHDNQYESAEHSGPLRV